MKNRFVKIPCDRATNKHASRELDLMHFLWDFPCQSIYISHTHKHTHTQAHTHYFLTLTLFLCLSLSLTPLLSMLLFHSIVFI